VTQLNIADYFLADRLRQGQGDRVALRGAEGTTTYAEVNELADSYAAALRAAGVAPDQRVFVALPDGVDFVGAFFGILKIGAVVVMVNPELAEDRVAELFEHCEPRAVVDSSVDGAFARMSDHFNARLVTPTSRGPADSVESVVRDSRDPAIWLFSGGTTGAPKAVVQAHGSFVNTTRRYAEETLGYSEDDVTLSVPKLFFGYATGSNLLFPFSVGASAVLFPEHPTPDILFELIARHKPTIMINVPTMVAAMVGHEAAGRQDLSSLRFATSAGEALPVELYRSWKATFGVELLDGLGTAEMWHIFITNRPDDVKPGTIGKPVAGFDVEVRDLEDLPVRPGNVGRLWVKGESLARGYWNDPDTTNEAFRGDWFVGGDLVRIDDDGYFEHHGRADDRLKVGGKWLAPQEVESCLLEHDAVDAAVVVGVPNEEGLIKPVAFVVAAEPSDGLADDLMSWVLERLEPYKHPRRVFVVDGLPTTHLGKVDRNRLKELAALE
jgi:benzoate-CoA ligase family protein